MWLAVRLQGAEGIRVLGHRWLALVAAGNECSVIMTITDLNHVHYSLNLQKSTASDFYWFLR